MKKVAIVTAILTAVTLSGCVFYVGPPRIISETVEIPAVETITIQAVVGSVEVVGTERTDVAITAYVSRSSFSFVPSATTPVEAIEIDIDTTDGILVRHTPFEANGISVSYEIEVPIGLSVDLVTSSTGSIQIHNISGDPILRTDTGSITADGISGTITAETATGSITVRNTNAVASLWSDTGSITAEIRDLAGPSVPIRTSTGSIGLWIDPSLGVSVFADTGTGSVTVHEGLQFVVTHSGSDGLEATMNGGGPLLSVRTGTGSIGFHPLD